MSDRCGAVLVLVVLVLVLLGLLAMALVFVSLQQARIVEARLASVRARFAAESAARLTAAEWRTRRYRELPVGAVRPVPAAGGTLPDGARHDAGVERLVGGLYLVRARGWIARPNGSVARTGVGMLLRGLAPLELQRDLRAALTTGGRTRIGARARIDGREAAATPAPWPDAVCPVDAEGPASEPVPGEPRPGLLVPDAASVQLEPGASIDGRPPIATDEELRSAAGIDGLGAATWRDLHALADRVETGAVAIGPRYRQGECDRAAAGNWGDPLDPTGACGDYFPLVAAPGDLELTDGAGQGILVVDGDLRLGSDVRFYGIILVGGRLLAPDGATLHGAALAGSRSGPSVWGGGTAAYRTCALRRALAGSPGLDRPLRASRRWWLPVF